MAVAREDYIDPIFHLPNPSIRAMNLGLTHPLIEMNIRKYFWKVERG
jgi:hypothetical protein